MNGILIREERKEDWYNTEHMVMRAFWNIHGPGCNEHLLVHKLRDDGAYLPHLSRVAEKDGKIVGAIFASKAKVTEQKADREVVHEVLTFGPLAVEPTCFSEGIGSALLQAVINLGRAAGYSGIVICGEPDYYPRHGFVTCDHFGITHAQLGNFPAFMAYPLCEAFAEVHGSFSEAAVFEQCEDEEELRLFTGRFPYYKPLALRCQWLHKERLGRISAVHKGSFFIRFWEKELPAKLKGSFYEAEAEAWPVVGDYVTFRYNPAGDSVILSVCERTSFLQRPDQAKTGVMQYMAANADYAFIITSLNEDYSYNRIARYAGLVLQGGCVPVVVLTKADLCGDPERYAEEVRVAENVRVHVVSALTGIGMEALDFYLQPGNTICLLGSSGVGKSTLLNVLAGEALMKTAAVRSSDSTGRHTTTHRQLIQLEGGVSIIDTPGMREVGLAGAESGIDDTFSDVIALERRCRFRNCRHDTEPGCAVKAALESGMLSPERLRLYQSLSMENEKNYAKKKEISKWIKAAKKRKDDFFPD
ncbi:MAG: ribosome small subunit-dependent GTPase A [Lachnospiraceae bacterium]|nr:ribosome small subunit-dependent GTPase A [Lachnospiraceae bacterium]